MERKYTDIPCADGKFESREDAESMSNFVGGDVVHIPASFDRVINEDDEEVETDVPEWWVLRRPLGCTGTIRREEGWSPERGWELVW